MRHQESSWRTAVHVSAHLVSRGPDGLCDLRVPLQNESVGLQLIRLQSKLRFLEERHGGRFQMYVEEPYTVPNRLRRKHGVSHSRKPLFRPLGSLGLVLVPRSRLRHASVTPGVLRSRERAASCSVPLSGHPVSLDWIGVLVLSYFS